MGRRFTPRRPLSPFLIRKALTSGINQRVIAQVTGFPSYNQYYTALRTPIIAATPLTVERLMRVADTVGFPRDEVFLDEPAKPRLVKRATALEATE